MNKLTYSQKAEAIVLLVDEARKQLGYIEVCGESPDRLRALNSYLSAIRVLINPN